MTWKQWKNSKRFWELLQLGVPKWIAKEYQGAYQLVAQKSVLKGAISKRIWQKFSLKYKKRIKRNSDSRKLFLFAFRIII